MMTITMIAAALLLQTVQDVPMDELPPQDMPGLEMQQPPLQRQNDGGGGEPSKSTLRAMEKRVEAMGIAYETMGRCAGTMSPSDVENTLRQAQQNPVMGQFLLQRYEKGFSHPKNDEWCSRNMAKAASRF